MQSLEQEIRMSRTAALLISYVYLGRYNVAELTEDSGAAAGWQGLGQPGHLKPSLSHFVSQGL